MVGSAPVRRPVRTQRIVPRTDLPLGLARGEDPHAVVRREPFGDRHRNRLREPCAEQRAVERLVHPIVQVVAETETRCWRPTERGANRGHRFDHPVDLEDQDAMLRREDRANPMLATVVDPRA